MPCARRAALSASAVPLLGGCSVLSSEDTAGESRLANILVTNNLESSHTFACRIEWEGERILDRTYTVPAEQPDQTRKPGVSVERVWPDEPGQFTVSCKLNDEAWTTLNPADRDYPDCYSPYGYIMSASTVRWFVGLNQDFCQTAQRDYDSWSRWNESRTE